jgi:dUTP pyrophosphatase
MLPTSIIDPGFTGELKICVYNISKAPYKIEVGDRLAQFIPMMDVPLVTILPVVDKNDLPTTERGDKGFGSTGDK